MSGSDFELEFDAFAGLPDEFGDIDVPLGVEMFTQRSFHRLGLRFSFSDLDPEFGETAAEVIEACEHRGVTLVPYTGVRTPWEQARLWRQSRSTATVNAAINRLIAGGGSFLAQVLQDVGPIPTGPKVTNALPGYSWHQWGEGLDCYWQVGGKPEWNDLRGYKVYAEEATVRGLTAGGYWTSLQDWPHIQKQSRSPAAIHSMNEINGRMIELFGDKILRG